MLLKEEILKNLILNSGVIDKETWELTEKEARQSGIKPIDVLLAKRLITKDFLYDLISQYLKVPRVKLRTISIPRRILGLIPEEFATNKKLVPFEEKGDVLKVAMAEPQNLEVIQLLENLTKKKIEPYLATEDEIRYVLTGYQEIKKEELEEQIRQQESELQTLIQKKAEITEASAVKLIENLINYAVGLNASDIHLEIFEDGSLIRFRIDGILRPIMKLDPRIHPALIARIKVLGNMQLDEHQKPQDGRIRHKVGENEFDIRVSVMPTIYGEKAVLRLLSASFRPLSLEELGMDEETQQKVQRNIEKTYGMILVTGPTGSGKTTTLYTVLNILNNPGVNICTIEDPIEYEIKNVNQTQVNPKAGIEFSTGLRALLRQDPDIIMIGEIRDFDTADIATQAALTGHLLLSTLHTNDAPTAIPRLIDLGVPPFLVSATVNAILAQRLVRKICLDCITSKEIEEYQKQMIYQQLEIQQVPQKVIEKIKIPERIYYGKGCQICGYSGFRGRTGIFEVLEITKEIRNLISQKKFTLDQITEVAREQGFITMFEDGLRKVSLGQTTIEEVLRVIKE